MIGRLTCNVHPAWTNIKFDPQLMAEVESAAKGAGKSVSKVLEDAVRLYVHNHGNGNGKPDTIYETAEIALKRELARLKK